MVHFLGRQTIYSFFLHGKPWSWDWIVPRAKGKLGRKDAMGGLNSFLNQCRAIGQEHFIYIDLQKYR